MVFEASLNAMEPFLIDCLYPCLCFCESLFGMLRYPFIHTHIWNYLKKIFWEWFVFLMCPQLYLGDNTLVYFVLIFSITSSSNQGKLAFFLGLLHLCTWLKYCKTPRPKVAKLVTLLCSIAHPRYMKGKK